MSDEWKSSSSSGEDAKSWKLLEKALLSSVQEQRRSRRWGIFFKLLTFICSVRWRWCCRCST